MAASDFGELADEPRLQCQRCGRYDGDDRDVHEVRLNGYPFNLCGACAKKVQLGRMGTMTPGGYDVRGE